MIKPTTRGEDDDVRVALGPRPGLSGAAASIDADPSALLAEQLESRRLSNLSASTSAATGLGPNLGPASGGAAAGMGRDPRSPATNGRGAGSSPTMPPAVPPARSYLTDPPAFPLPPRLAALGSPPAAGPRPPSPGPSAQVSAAAAELYASSPIAKNLAATTSTPELLVPLLDELQLQPPNPPGPGGGSSSNAQRVYKSGGGSAGAGGEGGGGGAAAKADADAASPKPRRKRAKVQVLDASEMLLARDEAVRAELLGRTWQDLLHFEERLALGAAGPATGAVAGTGQGEDGRAAAAGGQADAHGQQAAAPGLDDVLSFLQQTAAAQASAVVAQQQQQQQQQHEVAVASPPLPLSLDNVVSPAGTTYEMFSARLLQSFREAHNWREVRWLYLTHRLALTPEHVAAALVALSKQASRPGQIPWSQQHTFYMFWRQVQEHAVLSAPDMTGLQVVSVVGAIAALPFGIHQTVQQCLIAVQRLSQLSHHTIMPQLPPRGGAANAAGRGGRAAILNASQLTAAGRRGGAAPGPPPLSPQASNARDGAAAPAASPALLPPRGYAHLTYCLGRLNARSRPWRYSLKLPYAFLNRLLRGSFASFGSLGPREYAALIYGFAHLRVQLPPRWLLGFYMASGRMLGSMSHVQLTMLLYGACRQKLKPPPPWLDACLEAFVRRLDRMDAAGIGLALHALGRLRYKPRRPWLEAHMEAARRLLEARAVRPVELSALLRGMAFLGVKPEEEWLGALWQASGEAMARAEFSPAQLANMAWAVSLLKVPVPRRWFGMLLRRAPRLPQQLRPYHKRRLLTAFHAFGLRGKELQRWYEGLAAPLEDMPGYKQRQAMLAARRIKEAKAQLAEEQRLKELGQQGQAEGQGQAQAAAQEGPKRLAVRFHRRQCAAQLGWNPQRWSTWRKRQKLRKRSQGAQAAQAAEPGSVAAAAPTRAATQPDAAASGGVRNTAAGAQKRGAQKPQGGRRAKGGASRQGIAGRGSESSGKSREPPPGAS